MYRPNSLSVGHVLRRILPAITLASLLACGGNAEDRLVHNDAEQTLRDALERPAGIERVHGLVMAFTDLDSQTAARLADVMAEWEEKIPLYERRLLYLTWASRDAEAALRYAFKANENALQRTNVASTILRAVADQRPEIARSWFQSIAAEESGAFRTALAAALVEGWPASRVGFKGVAEVLLSMPLGFEQERAARMLVDNLVANGQMEVAMRWAESIPESTSRQFRSLAFRKVALTAGEVDPMRVSDWLEGQRANRQAQAGLRILARTWAKHDAVAALKWAMAQPDDRGRFLSIKFAFQQYYDDDKGAAEAWLLSQPDTDVLDSARLTYALTHASLDPASAAGQARQIHDESTRDDILAKVIREWSRSPTADDALIWINESGLPESYWTRILAPKARASKSPNPERPVRAPSEAPTHALPDESDITSSDGTQS